MPQVATRQKRRQMSTMIGVGAGEHQYGASLGGTRVRPARRQCARNAWIDTRSPVVAVELTLRTTQCPIAARPDRNRRAALAACCLNAAATDGVNTAPSGALERSATTPR